MATIPSIAMIPSGVKAGKLYSVLPTNGAGDFTTTRASVATRVNENGLIEEVAANVPRLDYSDGTCPSLLLEPTATNLIIYSEDFSNTSWNKTSIGTGSSPSVTVNQGLAPDGALNADRIVLDLNGGTTSSDYSFISDTVPINSGGVISLSIYLKSNTGSTQNLIMWEATTGTSLSCVVTNEWKRFNIIATVTSTSPGLNFGLRNAFGVTVDDTADVLAWGAQLEQNSYATSLIKTVGTTQTRTKDKTFKTGITNLIGQSEGVLFVDFIPKGNTATQIVYQVRTSGVTNVGQIDIRFSGGTLNALGNDGGSAQFGIVGTVINLGQRYKCAIRYKKNDVAFYINGVLIGTDVVASFNSSSKDQVSFGENLTSYVPVASIKDARVYTTALSDLELTNLTTI